MRAQNDTRGAAFGVAHDGYRVGDMPQTIRDADARCPVVVKIETALGVRDADEIMSVPGIDVGRIGHTDLSLSLGIPLQLEHGDLRAAAARVAAACGRHGKAAGCLVGDPGTGRAWIADGFRMVLYSGDIWLLGGALRAGIERLRA